MSEPAVRVEQPAAESPARTRRSMQRVVRIAARVMGASLLVLLLYLLLAPTGRYLVRAAWEEGKILARRRAITDFVNDSASSASTRRKLEIVLAS
ncbi:MAG TPA: hypothetical protein VH080_06685, partial [Gemmatimonadaceae bacterium]|nr:hypothetical protein [Gemmatimonadaceae bacterium]